MIYIGSYLAILLLLMHASPVGIMQTAALLVGGILFVIWKKPKVTIELFTKEFVIIALEIVCYLGYVFFERWVTSSKLRAIANLLHVSAELFVLSATIVLSICALILVIYVLHNIFSVLNNLSEKHSLSKNLICGFVASVVTLILTQIMIIETDIFLMGPVKFCWGVIIVYVVVVLLYCVLGRIKLSIMIGTALFMLISTVNVYMYSFRGRLFEPIDVFSFGTAMNVADNYSLWPIPTTIISGWGIWIALLVCILSICPKGKTILSVKTKIAITGCCLTGMVAIGCYTFKLDTYHWTKEGAWFSGYVLDFVAKFKEAFIFEPEGYTDEKIEELAEKYNKDMTFSDDQSTPHIIVIMDEAFSDLSVLGDVTTNKEVMPYISSLEENTISGYALASIFGGTTANSEYEFLTGNTMAWFSPNVVPYQQYIHSSAYSMVSYLKTYYDYICIAMHPYWSDGWNRPNTYKNFGFDESLFIESFPQKKFVRSYISDQEMFEEMIRIYENRNDEPLFLFGVSMQNHGDYNYIGDDFKQTISLGRYESEYPTVEQYLSLISETDKAVEYLISYFSKVNDDVVVVFFGDHQPRLEDAFYHEIEEGNVESLDIQQNRYKIPFFVWTNYDSEEKYIECTSLNYLTSYVYESAGIELPPYNRFLSDMEDYIPAINANGFYSSKSGGFLSFDEAFGEESLMLEQYKMLQYNNVFGGEKRNKKLFGVLE